MKAHLLAIAILMTGSPVFAAADVQACKAEINKKEVGDESGMSGVASVSYTAVKTNVRSCKGAMIYYTVSSRFDGPTNETYCCVDKSPGAKQTAEKSGGLIEMKDKGKKSAEGPRFKNANSERGSEKSEGNRRRGLFRSGQ